VEYFDDLQGWSHFQNSRTLTHTGLDPPAWALSELVLRKWALNTQQNSMANVRDPT